MNIDIAEQVCQAVDTIVTEKLKSISYDQTITCTITDSSKSENGVYKVTNGNAIFYAYSSDTTYDEGDVVYVSIPNGNYDNDKIILSKKPSESEKPLSYVNPFNRFVDITGNLVPAFEGPVGLLANGKTEQKDLWSYNDSKKGILYQSSGDTLAGYTRLGIKASFMAWLKEVDAVSGSYGIRLRLKVDPEAGQETQTAEYLLEYDCSDMIGNPYNFESFYEQQVIFDISQFNEINSFSLEFYQKKGSFKTLEGLEISSTDLLGNELLSNIFIKDIYIAFGYDTNEMENDSVIIYSLNNTQFTSDSNVQEEENHKRIQLRWVHQNNNGLPISVNDLSGLDYTITWYRRVIGSSSDTVYSGVDWAKLSEQVVENGVVTCNICDESWKQYNEKVSLNGIQRFPSLNETWLLPDITMAEERVKAIITFEGQPYRSNILTFTNKKEVVSKPTLKAVQALTINCEDDTFGNYLIYKLGGSLLDNAEGQKPRKFKAYFNNDNNQPAELTEAQSIEWIIPSKNTMIVLDSDAGEPSDDGYYHIKRNGDSSNGYHLENNEQAYRISSYYNSGKSDNTIKCVVTRDNTEYTAIKELSFGPAGTAGTDFSFVLDFNDGVTALTLKNFVYDAETGEQIGTESTSATVRAQLYDYNNQQIDLTNQKVYWSWLTEENNYININASVEENDGYYTQNGQVELTLVDDIEEVPIDNFSILIATLKDYPTKNGNFDLQAFLPIPIRLSPEYQYISGPTIIRYNSLGYLEDYQQTPYQMFSTKESINYLWNLYSKESGVSPTFNRDNNELVPKNIYMQDEKVNQNCIYAYSTEEYDGIVVWSQPLYIYQNKYPSSIINNWDGSLQISKDKNYILAAKIAAGKKDSENQFSGVIMGDWSGKDSEEAVSQHTGLYGFYKGAASFGFRDNGTAFIGQPGQGRIEFNGEKSTIQSNRKAQNEGGMLLDFDDGLIQLESPKNEAAVEGTISINAKKGETPFTIGSYFSVDWDGTIHATNGNFEGTIDGSKIIGSEIEGASIEAGSLNVDYLEVNESATVLSDFEVQGNITFGLQTGTRTKYQYKKGNKWYTTYNKSVYDNYISQGYSGKTSEVSYIDVGGGYLGAFKGSENNKETKLIGMRLTSNSYSGIAIESEEGANIRIGNQSINDSLFIQGDSIRITTPSSYNNFSGYFQGEQDGSLWTTGSLNEMYIKAQEITFVTPDPENQHGIYARFA